MGLISRVSSRTYSSLMEDSGHPILDIQNAQSGSKIWLLSVPKYLGEQWLRPECRNKIVGKLTLESSPGQKMKVTYTLAEQLANSPPDSKKMRMTESRVQPGRTMQPSGVLKHKEPNQIPRDHEFKFNPANNSQLLGIISKTKNLEHTELRKLEGVVVQRAQLKPPRSEVYDKFKSDRIRVTNAPKQMLKTCTIREAKNAQRNQTEVMDNERHVAKQRQMPRMEQEELRERIFGLYQTHDWYQIHDFVKITQQPQKAIREVLVEIAQQGKTPETRHKWELRADFKH